MSKQNQKSDPDRLAPGPGRSTANAAFDELRREIAQRNERAHQEARKARAPREREELLKRRQRD
jgi:hypothetical protein